MNQKFVLYLNFLLIFFISFNSGVFGQFSSTENSKEDPEAIDGNVKIEGYVYITNPELQYFTGLTMNFEGLEDVVVNTYGKYYKYVPQGWSGNVSPNPCDPDKFVFDPPQYTYVDVQATTRNQNFDVTTDTIYSISGTITDSLTGAPLANTEVTFDIPAEFGPPFSIEVNTNAQGEYSFYQLPCLDAPLNPRVEFHYITPFSRTYNNWQQSYINHDYKFIYYEKPIPPEWEYTITAQSNPAVISITAGSNPRVCGVPIELGDLIGVFYTGNDGELHCGGFGRWQDESNVGVIAYGDDTQATPNFKEGFSYNEYFKWKFHSYAIQDDLMAEAEMILGYNRWAPIGLSVTSDLEGMGKEHIVVPAGWSGISSVADPEGSKIVSNILSPIINELIILQSKNEVYWPGGGVPGDWNWSDETGYKIKLTSPVVLPIYGCPGTDKTLSLTTGWNIIPVLSPCNMLLSDVLAPIMSRIIVVKEIGGNRIFWPDMNITTLQVLQPGKAYYVAVSQNSTFTFPACDALKSNADPTPEITPVASPWQDPHKTGTAHILAFPAGLSDALSTGDFVGAFTSNDYCAGFALIENPETNLALTVFGDDPTTALVDGFAEGEIMNFKIFKNQQKEELVLEPEYDLNLPSADGRFTDNGLSVISNLKLSPNGIADLNSRVRFSPNPSTGMVYFQANNRTAYTISICNLSGQQLLLNKFRGESQLDLRDFKPGIYFVSLTNDQQTRIEKLILR